MAIPRIDAVRALVLQLCGDDQEHRYVEMERRIVDKLGLTADDLAEKLSNGRTKSLQNRVYWSFRSLEKASKLSRVRRVSNCRRGEVPAPDAPRRDHG